ncbi:CHASE domain-containing protein [Inhella sp.]|uniref:CHASE domain-containing protein n=1 Tax=Inhella sp. TaxID=1921806 RepID=UPI0035B2F100
MVTPHRTPLSSQPWALGLWLLGLLLTLALAMQVHRSNERAAQQRFERVVDELARGVQERFGLYELGLRGARGAALAAGGIGLPRQAFAAYANSRELEREFPGARGFGLIQRVPRAEEARFVAQMRAQGLSDFAVRELSPHGEERLVIRAVEPEALNRQALGLDIASEPNRREAARQAALSGEARLTAPLTLMQAAESPHRGFLLLLPVYAEGADLRTPGARERATQGWVHAPLLADAVLRSLGAGLDEVHIRLVDQAERSPFFRTDAEGERSGTGLSTQRALRIMGRNWQLQADAQPALLAAAQPRSPAAVLAIGVALSSLGALLLGVLTRQREQQLQALGLPEREAARPLRAFATSRLTLGALLLWLLGVLAYAAVAQSEIRARRAAELARHLQEQARQLVTQREQQREARRKVLTFLAETPPVLGLWRSLPTGVDPLDGSDRAHWQRRMQQIFSAHLRTAPEVQSLSLRYLDRPASESLSVLRVDGQLVARAGALVTEPDPSPHLALALRQPTGTLYIAAPRAGAPGPDGRPRWSYEALLAVDGPPGSTQGRPVAVLSVVIDLSERLESLRSQLPAGEQLYVLDSQQQLMVAPPGLRAPTPVGELLRWPQVFHSVASPWVDAEPALRAWAGPSGTLLLAQALYQPNQRSDEAEQALLLGQPQEQLEQEVRSELGQRLRIPLALGPVGLLLLYLLWTANERQQRMRAERLRQARVLDQSRDAFIGLDGEQRIRSWNQGAQALFGWQADEVRSRALAELLHAEAPWPQPQDPACRFETRVRRGSADAAEPLEVAVDWTPLQGEDGGGSLTLRDIGQERAAQRRVLQLNAELEGQVMARTADLLHERERLANILEGTHVGTWEWNVQTGATRHNPRWAEMLGYTLDELQPITPERMEALTHPDDRAAARQLMQAHLRNRDSLYEVELRLRHRDGHWVWVLSRGRVLSWTEDGRPEWMYGTHQDITELKQAQQRQQRAARLLQQVLAAATEVSVIATDTEGVITVFNPGAERLLGYRAEDMVGRQTPAVLHLPEEVQARGQELSQASGRPVEGFRVFVHLPEQQGSELREWTYVRQDGSQVPVALVVTAMRDEADRLIGYLGIAQDISERRRAEQTLREAKQVAEAANAAKSLFLANMSHEIRTPMNAVLGVAHLLQDTPLDAEQRTLLGKLQLAGRSLMAIINDVLDLAKIEAGELRLEQLPVRPQQLLDEVRALMEPQAQAKGLGLHTELDPALPELISSDPQRLRQILLNLSSNAIKFTAQGAVRLRARLEADATGAEWLCWEVQDSGIGITPEAQAQLFRPFVQADASTTRHYGGTGLGLAIVRELSERLGGTVSLRSQPGEGSCFTVRLPLQRAEASSASGGLRVLIVEDEAAQREALAAQCRSLGWQIEALDSGEALLQRLAQPGPEPDVMLLDWQLGAGPDGLSTLQQQVQSQGADSLPAVLVISAAAPERLRAAAGSEWSDALLHKPVQPSDLFNAVNRAVVRRTGSLERVLQATRIDALDAAWLPGVRVLVVDDSELNREVAQRLLSREGALVQTADGGAAALALLQASDPPPFDAVLMDVQMPGMDGLETTRRLRQLPGGAELPVLALTAGALEEERQRALAAGMDGFLTKPLEPAQLVRSLRHSVEARRREPLAAARSTPALASAEGDEWPLIAGIDHAQSQLLMGGQRELFLQSLRRLLDEHLPALEAWQTADLEAERADWLARLHKLRGSAGQLGARSLHSAASAAEQALRSSAPTLPPLLDAVRQALRALSQAAAPALQAAAQRRPQTSGPPPEGPAWQALLAQLRANDLEALSDYQRYLPGLAQALGAERAEAWEQQVANLQFPAALRLLEEAGLTGPDR